jgi:hypothetical protein
MPDEPLDLASRAQTHLQLYADLARGGYPDRALESVGAAYDAAMGLFTGQFRGDGRPFIAHLVGTAAILARLRAPIDVVLAGLLHSAYEFGDFGDGTNGVDAAKRRRVEAVAGPGAERLIAAYTAFPWNQGSIVELSRRVDGLSEQERQLVFIRLANIVDESMDCGVLYCDKAGYLMALMDQTRSHLKQLAIGIGQPPLAAAVEQLCIELKSAQIASALRRARPGSFVLPPASYSERSGVKLRKLLQRLHGRVARHRG